eukprot:6295652-Amphidinium_carterae.1
MPGFQDKIRAQTICATGLHWSVTCLDIFQAPLRSKLALQYIHYAFLNNCASDLRYHARMVPHVVFHSGFSH